MQRKGLHFLISSNVARYIYIYRQLLPCGVMSHSQLLMLKHPEWG